MFKPRCLMTPHQRDQLDAQYADLLAFRRELATMNVIQKEARARDLCGELVYLRRIARLDCAGLVACLMATTLTLIVAITMRSSLSMLATCLLPLCALRLFNIHALSRDIYFGTLRQYHEIDMPPEPSRFDG
jgi:hypothetical protein